LAERYDVSLVHSFFPLHPDTPPEGQSLAELFRGRGFDIPAAHARMKKLMDAEGLPFHPQDRTYNSRLAQELGKWGGAQAPRLHDALYRAHFAEGKDIYRTGRLLDIAREQGLDPAEAERVLADRTYRDAVDQDWARARELGVTGVPTFVTGEARVVGAQPYEVLEALVRSAGARPRA
jgi:predicted DsbA family dithiol-disulfide isomerase